MVLIPEILQAHAMIPVIRARIMETTEIKNVDLSPVKKRGRYSNMILKLKSTSIGPSVRLWCAPQKESQGCTPGLILFKFYGVGSFNDPFSTLCLPSNRQCFYHNHHWTGWFQNKG